MSLEPFTSSTMPIIINSIIVVIHDGNISSSSPSYNNDTTSPLLTTQLPGQCNSNLESVTHGFTQAKIIVVLIMLILFSIFGCLGNGLVLYVFSKKSDKVTSTIFILALAWTDFFTCVLLMPFTATFLQLDSHLYLDFFCKLYQFLNTSSVPLSAYIMVAIAVDRYFSICHPFMRVVTPRRARAAILCLVLIASIFGSITACLYGVHTPPKSINTSTTNHDNSCSNNNNNNNDNNNNNNTGITSLVSGSYYVGNSSLTQVPGSLTPTSPTYNDIQGKSAHNSCLWISSDRNRISADINTAAQDETPPCATENHVGMCVLKYDILSARFAEFYQKVYISFYVISLVAVFTLYFFIYRSVAERRAWRRKQKSWSHSPMTITAAVTEADELNKGDDMYTGDGDNLELSPQNNSLNMSQSNSKDSGSGDSTETKIEIGTSSSIVKSNMASLSRNRPHENGASNIMLSPSAEKKANRERRDFNFLANIRTALMLFVVTLVFIISFLPAWLMATQIIQYEIIIFYAHFVYNVANPVIYAFMNQSFRKELKRVFQRDCGLVCCNKSYRMSTDRTFSRTGMTAVSMCDSPVDAKGHNPICKSPSEDS